jgi:alanine racemase
LEQEYALHQLSLFKMANEALVREGICVPMHIASSASALILKESQFNYVRTGISLYGLWPSRATRLSFAKLYDNIESLRPVLSWRTKISSVKTVAKDCYIGYGCTYRAIKDMCLAIIPVGYYEGYPRLAGEHSSHVLIHGTRCPIVGRVCMNMMMADVTHLSQPQSEDIVTLIGRDGKEEIEAEVFAGWSNTIHYEALTRLNPLIPRITVS